MKKKLLIIVPDKISSLNAKGEVVERYYNPGNLFEEVHIVMTNDDNPDPKEVQPWVGNAKLFLYNHPIPKHYFKATLGWQFIFLKKWASAAVRLARDIQPSLIRTHNNFLEGYLAASIKKELNLPYVTSLHGVWDVDDLSHWKAKIYRLFRKKIEVKTLKNADAVFCVYSSIVDYAKRHGAQDPILLHNFVSSSNIKRKKNWLLSNPIRLITVNRQLPEKNPENIIKSIALLPYKIHYTLIGTGILHESLKLLAKELNLQDSIQFIQSLPNDKVGKLYTESDFLVTNCHYKGISKTVIEAALSALPVIINQYADGYQLSEYQGDWLEQCEDTPQGYANAINRMVLNDEYREKQGEKSYKYAKAHFDPVAIENKVAEIYQNLIKKV